MERPEERNECEKDVFFAQKLEKHSKKPFNTSHQHFGSKELHGRIQSYWKYRADYLQQHPPNQFLHLHRANQANQTVATTELSFIERIKEAELDAKSSMSNFNCGNSIKYNENHHLHSLKLTYPLKTNGWKMNFPFGMPCFQGLFC